jgi:hypothetical protein
MTYPKAELFYEKSIGLMENLYNRWQDEREYEDFNDYVKPLQPIAAECGVEIVSMKKRPFSVVFTSDGKKFAAVVTSKTTHFEIVA